MEDKARVPVAIKPVAYVYSKPGMQVEFRLCTERCFAGDGWTEEPLYAAPPAVPGEVEPLTYDEVEQIIEKTEPAQLSDRGDRIWTRRMAVALADLFNSRLSAQVPLPEVEGGDGWQTVELSPRQLEAIKEALAFRIAGEIDGDIQSVVYERALDKVSKLGRKFRCSLQEGE